MSETPFCEMPKADEIVVDCNMQDTYETTRTITMLPSGPEWITRQSDEEVLSLPWGWSDEQREEIISMSRRASLLKTCIYAVGLIMGLVIAFYIWNGFPIFFPLSPILTIFIATVIVRLAIGIVSFWHTYKLKVKFYEGMLDSSKNADGSEIEGQKIQVMIQDYNSWLLRQTSAEILSMEGWTADDLVELIPLLEEKELVLYRLNIAIWVTAFTVWIWIIPEYFFPQTVWWIWVFWMGFTTAVVIPCVALHFFTLSLRQLDDKLKKMFFTRFMLQVSEIPDVEQSVVESRKKSPRRKGSSRSTARSAKKSSKRRSHERHST